MTRQNVTDGPRELMTKQVPDLRRRRDRPLRASTALDIERRLRALVTPGSRSPGVPGGGEGEDRVLAGRARRMSGSPSSKSVTKRRFFLEARDGLHLDHFLVLDGGHARRARAEGSCRRGRRRSSSSSSRSASTTRRAGVGKLEDSTSASPHAAKLVGKKVKVKVSASWTTWRSSSTPGRVGRGAGIREVSGWHG